MEKKLCVIFVIVLIMSTLLLNISFAEDYCGIIINNSKINSSCITIENTIYIPISKISSNLGIKVINKDNIFYMYWYSNVYD